MPSEEVPLSHSGHDSEALLTRLSRVLDGLDPLLIATALSFTCLTPGPAGEAAAVGAIAYDVSQRRWYGVVLSALSMIPLLGYLPAVFKIALLLLLLTRRMKSLDTLTPEIRTSPEALANVREALGKYYRQLPDIWPVRGIRRRLARIMALGIDGLAIVSPTPAEVAE